MRINQLKLLNNDELSALLWVINRIEPLVSTPRMEYGPKDLLWFKHDAILWKLAQSEQYFTSEFKHICHSLMVKLNKHPIEEAQEAEKTRESEIKLLEFNPQLELQLEFETKKEFHIESRLELGI